MNILNYLKTFVVVVVAAMAFTSCSKEQTSLSIYDFQGRAKIMGHVSYPVREEYQKDSETPAIPKVIWESAANKQLFIKINNSSFVRGEAGVTVIQTKTDKNGNYEIEIPVPEEGVRVAIQGEYFIGNCNLFVKLDNQGKEQYKLQEGVFYMDAEDVSLEPNEIVFYNLRYDDFDARELEEEEEEESVRALTVQAGLGSFDTDGDVYFKSQSGIEVTLTNGKDSWKNTTNSYGLAAFFVPRSVGNVTITANYASSSSFNIYDRYNQQYSITGGTWQQYYRNDVNQSQSVDLSYYYSTIKVKMVYVTSTSKNGYYWSDYSWNYADFE